MFAVAETQSYAIAIRCNGFDWKPIALGADEVAKRSLRSVAVSTSAA
jgi:hypothetical protein